MGVKPSETKLLGLSWDKVQDSLAVTFPKGPIETTKRELLKGLASVFYPLGVASPIALVGKVILREVCDNHCPWDAPLQANLQKQWDKFKNKLPN